MAWDQYADLGIEEMTGLEAEAALEAEFEAFSAAYVAEMPRFKKGEER